jgi:hypothetical protein
MMTEESYKTLEPAVIGLAKRFDMMKCTARILGCDNSKMTGSKLVHHFPHAHFMEDVPHVLRRFHGCFDVRHLGEVYGPCCAQLAACFYVATAKQSPNGVAIYHKREDQAARLQAWYEKWKAAGAFRKNQPAVSDIDTILRTQMELINQGACTHNCERYPRRLVRLTSRQTKISSPINPHWKGPIST